MASKPEEPDLEAELGAAFASHFGALEREVQVLRRRVERQSRLAGDRAARERAHRKIIETQYQLLRSRDRNDDQRPEPGRVLTIPVHEAMGLTAVAGDGAADAKGATDALSGWLDSGGETDALVRTEGETEQASKGDRDPADRRARIYRNLPRPMGLSFVPSPGLAAYALNRREARALGFNLIGAADARLEHLAEEIAQSVALNRRFVPVIFTTTRAGLGAFRRRGLTYESLPPFDRTVAQLSGLDDARTFYDMRIGYLIRKWRIQAVMNLGSGYIYQAPEAS